MPPPMLDLAGLRTLDAGGTSLPEVADALAAPMAATHDPAIFITAVDRAGPRRQADDLLRRAPAPNRLPLWGVPCAIKDNIDVAGLPTTAGCPAGFDPPPSRRPPLRVPSRRRAATRSTEENPSER